MAAVNKSLKRPEAKRDGQEMVYISGGAEVKLTPAMVRDYMVSGDKERVSMPELVNFMNLCKYSGLNPWLKEAYCIKYGSEPATMVVGKNAFLKRAGEHPAFDGMASGIIVYDAESGETSYMNGTFYLNFLQLVGGWAEVYRKDQKHPIRIEVSFDEYAQRNRDGKLMSNWAKKPATMIRKVAQTQALREAFPTAFSGLYGAEEMGYSDTENEPVTDDEVTVVADTTAEEKPSEDIGAALFE